MLLEALETLELEESKHEELDGCQGQGRDGIVLQACIVPDWRHTQELLAHDACHCCHSPAAVDLLSLSIPEIPAPTLPYTSNLLLVQDIVARDFTAAASKFARVW